MIARMTRRMRCTGTVAFIKPSYAPRYNPHETAEDDSGKCRPMRALLQNDFLRANVARKGRKIGARVTRR
jgi:hypothetical protein